MSNSGRMRLRLEVLGGHEVDYSPDSPSYSPSAPMSHPTCPLYDPTSPLSPCVTTVSPPICQKSSNFFCFYSDFPEFSLYTNM